MHISGLRVGIMAAASVLALATSMPHAQAQEIDAAQLQLLLQRQQELLEAQQQEMIRLRAQVDALAARQAEAEAAARRAQEQATVNPLTREDFEDAVKQAEQANQKAAEAQQKAAQAQQKADEAAEKVATSESNVEFEWAPSPTIRSKDGNFEVHVRGRVFADAAWLEDDNSNVNSGQGNQGVASELRAARLGIEGKAWKEVKYKFEVDFADNEVDLKDATIGYKWATVGQFKTQNSLEEQTSARFTTFLERAAFTDAFNLDRRIGFGGKVGGKNWAVDSGIFSQNAGEEAINETFAVATRGHYALDLGGEQTNVVHLGAHSRFRFCDSENSDGISATRCANESVQYRQRPFFHTSRVRHIDTGTITGVQSDVLAGGEFAWVGGPFSVQAEGAYTNVQRTRDELNSGDLWGGYVDVSYFVTGESRNYSKGSGKFGRVKVKNALFEPGGFGAIQLAGRFDYVSLTDSDAGIEGGEQYSAIAGVNWYMNDHVRFVLDYAHTKVMNGPEAVNDADGNSSINGVGLRAQVDF